MNLIFKVVFMIIFYATASTSRQLPARLHPKAKGLDASHNNDNFLKKRGLDVGILVNIPTTKQSDTDIEKLEALLENAPYANRLVDRLEGLANADRMAEEKSSDCPSCEEEEEVKRIIKPAYKCDDWDPKHRACVLERNLGDTVTFYLSTGREEGIRQPKVQWKKEFHKRDSKERQEFIIDPDNPPENVIIGRRGFELRISPITETDLEYNMFSATLQAHTSIKLYFMIRIVPIDLGFVYVGETIELNLLDFGSLPEHSMSYKWYMEKDGEYGTLPSNMKVSITGSSIKISELRQEQEGLLACSLYTNLDILATKKRFLIKELSKNKDVLQSSPNHSLIFEEEFRKKRVPKKLISLLSSFRLARQKRDRMAAEEVERALLQPTASEREIPYYTTRSIRYNEDNSYNEMQGDEPQNFEDSMSNFQEISDNAEDFRNYPVNKKIDLEIYRKPAAVEKQPFPKQPPPVNKELPFQDISPIEKPLPHNTLQKQDNPQLVNVEYIQNANVDQQEFKPNTQDVNSDIVLNIDRIPPHKPTAEEQIARLISFCVNDYECAITATCVRISMKKPGFCKCIPGSNGVGVFCREEVWLSNSNFNEEKHDLDFMAYSNSSPI